MLLESYVSRMKWVEKRHPNMHALTLDHLFMYRARRQREKDARRAASMRSTRGGGVRKAARERAAEGRALLGGSRNKLQQRLLCRQAEARAGKLAAAAKAIFKRGGHTAMRANFYIYCHFVGERLKTMEVDNDEFAEVHFEHAKMLDFFWNDVGEWKF